MMISRLSLARMPELRFFFHAKYTLLLDGRLLLANSFNVFPKRRDRHTSTDKPPVTTIKTVNVCCV